MAIRQAKFRTELPFSRIVEPVLAGWITTNVFIIIIYSKLISFAEGSWDSLDVTSAYLEGDNLFAATKMTQHFGQKIDKCVDFYRECKSDSDCISLLGEVCQENRCFVILSHVTLFRSYWKGPNWCNSEGNTLTVEFDITDHYFLLFKSQVQFSELGRRKGL